MASLVKGQILKHLSKYVKKLSSDRINVSTLKGEGELTDLELDEEVLTELLALPIWMKIKKANCNRARLMIQWTKLKSIPIRLVLDTIEIEIEACEELRPVATAPNPHLTLPTAGTYGFVHKVVDGITVTVEAVEIRFFSKAFESKVQISRIRVDSKSPQWKKVELPQTRLKDMERGELLTFKEIEWQTLRLEAQSTKEKHLAPLRLLTNQAKARIAIKKKLSDCSVIGCRLSLILDDLLWVLTDGQILAAAHFMSSLSGLVKQATEMVKAVKAVRKLETSLNEYRVHQQLQVNAMQERTVHSDASRIFDMFDVKETSYHLICEKIDLHFCDDPGGGRSNHPDLRDGGAGQVQLTQLMVDFYPYHLAKTDRRHWFRYSNNDLYHWLKTAQSSFNEQIVNLFSKRSSGAAAGRPGDVEPDSSRRQSGSDAISTRLSEQLMSTCLIVKIRDICVYKVTTSSRETPMPFISSYLERPKDISAVNMEFTWFYYPGGSAYPLPSPKFYTQVNPLALNLDTCTILWLNSFLTNIQSSLPHSAPQNDSDYLDVRLELIMPKIIIEEKISHPTSRERPTALQVQASRITVSNYRSRETGTTAQLATAIGEIEKLYTQGNGMPQIPAKLVLHSQGLDNVRDRAEDHDGHLTSDALWSESRDVWCIGVDTVWADFCVDSKVKCGNNGDGPKRKFRSSTLTSQSESLLVPFVDSVPLLIWLHSKEEPIDPDYNMGNRKDIKAILRVDGMCNIQLTKQQYLFLLRTAEAISEISLFLTIDTRKTYIVARRDDTVELIGCIPRLEVSFLLPPTDSDLPRENSSLEDYMGPSGDPLSVEDSPTRGFFVKKTMDPNPVSHIKPQMEAPTWNKSTEGAIEPQMEAPTWNKSIEGIVEPQMASWCPEESQMTAKMLANIPDLPDSPEKFYSELPAAAAGSPSTNSLDAFKSSFSQGMKQGISSLVVSFNKAGGNNTPDSEVTSLWSTDSSENNFITLDPEQEPSNFQSNSDVEDAVEVAEEVIEDNSQSTGSFSVHNPYGKEDTVEINILTVSLNGMQIGQFSEGLSSRIALCCKSLSMDESEQVSWKDFQTLFATRGKKWRTDNDRSKLKTEHTDAITLSFTQRIDDVTFMNCITSDEMINTLKEVKGTKVPRVNQLDRSGPESPIRKAVLKSTHPLLKAHVDLGDGRANEGQQVTLHSGILKSAANFFEDECPPSLLPLSVSVVGADMEIIDDKNPTFPPTQFRLNDVITVIRNEDGIFNIGFPKKEPLKAKPGLNRKLCNGDETSSELESVDDLKRQIWELKKQISDLQQDKSLLTNQLNLGQKKS